MRRAFVVFVFVLVGDFAAAQEVPASVALRFDGCMNQLRSLLAIELRADGVRRVVTDDEDAIARIELLGACEAARVEVRIVDRATSKRLARTVPMGDVAPEARARVLALAVAGLLRASWAELTLPGAPQGELEAPAAVRRAVVRRVTQGLGLRGGAQLDAPSPSDGGAGPQERVSGPELRPGPGGELPPDERRASRPRRREHASAREQTPAGGREEAGAEAAASWEWRVGAAATGRAFFGPATLLGGARAFADLGPLRFGIVVESGLARDELGRVRHTLGLAEFAAEILRYASSSATLALRLRVVGGWARLRGISEHASVVARSVDGAAFGAGIFGVVRFSRRRTRVELELGFGAMAGPRAQADGRDVSALDGLYAGLGLTVVRSGGGDADATP